ncbi:Protein FAM135A [Hondaea fermentalgiana]|uniref:Protein FAM135A n=1 Tax=Hondaea fermentalgiana TaxID=2315210 RepID=A0A2R5GGK6_9STRA|nr:Protein FAM135A [Hondaea fermentalgiana]|eukprot:GBG28888.1 Protein FAM135A [Hondaea fermentalgiana]
MLFGTALRVPSSSGADCAYTYTHPWSGFGTRSDGRLQAARVTRGGELCVLVWRSTALAAMASLQAAVEVGVCLMTFNNVDLNQQGYVLYRLSLSVAKGADELRLAAQDSDHDAAVVQGKRNKNAKDPRQGLGAHADAPVGDRATPYACFESDMELSHVEGRKVVDSMRHQSSASISGLNDVYYSKGFIVRYVDEKRQLNDGVHFRIEVDALKERDIALRLCICLERAPIPVARETEPPEFEILAARTVQLNRVGEGLHEYVPIIFDDFLKTGFALLETTVHACVTNLKYEPDASGLRLAQYLLSGREDRDLDDTIDEDFAQDLEMTRRNCIFLLRSSHASLAACVDLLIRKIELADAQSFSSGGIPVEPLAPVEVAPRLAGGSDGARNVEEFATAFSTELETWSSTLLLAWHGFLQNLQSFTGKVRRDLKSAWLEKATDKVGEIVLRERVPVAEFKSSTSAETCRKREEVAAKIRQCQVQIRQFHREKVEDFEMFEDDASHPILFEQRYETRPLSSSSSFSAAKLDTDEPSRTASMPDALTQDVGLARAASPPPAPLVEVKENVEGEDLGVPEDIRDVVVFVHGYLGSSWDLRAFRNYLLIVEPDTITLLSKANEEDTDSDIEVLGTRLANEVKAFLVRTFAGETFKLGRLSLLSMSSPHLGARAMKSTLVKYGLWAMRHWRKASALGQLALTDFARGGSVKDTYVYKLSESETGLRNFSHVVLISSHQDQYVPYHSARVEYLEPGPYTTKADVSLAHEMCDNLLAEVDPAKVTRVDIAFQFDSLRTNRMDKFIGRAAHICILDSAALSLTLLLHFKELFAPTIKCPT